MNDRDRLTQQFEENRIHLRTVALRILGSRSDAEDAVQEAWLRLNRSDISQVENLTGWLTTVVARIALNMLQSRQSRREDPQGAQLPDALAGSAGGVHPEDEAVLADSVGPALVVVLDTLAPAERLAFVLHDMFAVPFEDIAPIVGRTPAAARQLASRARRRVQGADSASSIDRARQRAIVSAFLAASRTGRFGALLALLDPDVVLRADDAAVRLGAAAQVRGASAVAETFSGRAKAALPSLVDGRPGAVWSVSGRPRVVFDFTVIGDRIVGIEMLSDADLLSGLELEPLPD